MENLVNLCMDSYGMEQQKGRIYHLYSTVPITFCSLPEAFKKMEALYDDIDFPQASTKIRSFLVNRRRREIKEAEHVIESEWMERKGGGSVGEGACTQRDGSYFYHPCEIQAEFQLAGRGYLGGWKEKGILSKCSGAYETVGQCIGIGGGAAVMS